MTNYRKDNFFEYNYHIRMHKRQSPHDDYNHMGASHELIKSYNVGKIIINSYEDNQKL